MTYIHINAPKPVTRNLIRKHCPHCKKRRFMIVYYYEWYGANVTCLKCGDSWSDGEMHDRPFLRGWRKLAITEAKRHWRRFAAPTGEQG